MPSFQVHPSVSRIIHQCCRTSQTLTNLSYCYSYSYCPNFYSSVGFQKKSINSNNECSKENAFKALLDLESSSVSHKLCKIDYFLNC